MATVWDDLGVSQYLAEEFREAFYNKMKLTVVLVRLDQSDGCKFGGGVLVGPGGLVVTAFHVIGRKAKQVMIRCYKSEFTPAKVLYVDSTLDLALLCWKNDLEVEAYVAFCPAEKIRVGMQVIAISHPGALTYTCTFGEICHPADLDKDKYPRKHCIDRSNIRRRMFDARHQNLLEMRSDLHVVQMNNTHLAAGSSGSPIFDSAGLLVGVYLYDFYGFDFCVHVSTIHKFILEGVDKHERKKRPAKIPEMAGNPSEVTYEREGQVSLAALKAERGTVRRNLVGENGKAIHRRGGNKLHSNGSCFMKKYSENVMPKFSYLPVSGDSSTNEVLPQIKKGFASLDHAKADSARELGNTARSISSSHSQNLSPANLYNSKYWRRARTTSPNSSGGSARELGNTARSISSSQSQNSSPASSYNSKCLRMARTPAINSTGDSARELGNTARSISSSHSQNSSRADSYNPKYWRRASTTTPNSTGDSKKVQGNPSGDTNGSTVPSESTKCYQDVDNACATNFTQTCASQSKYSCDKQNPCPKLLPSPLHTESKQNAETEVGDQKLLDKSSVKEISLIPESGENDKTVPSQVQLPWFPEQSIATDSVKNILPNLPTTSAIKKSMQNASVERQGVSLKDGNMKTKSSISLLNFAMQKKHTVRFSERKLEVPQNTVLKTANSASGKKDALPCSSLKRKILEELEIAPDNLKPLKCVFESTIQRREPLESYPTTNSLQVVPAVVKNLVLDTGNSVAYQGNVFKENLACSNSIPKMKSASDLEIPVLIENGGKTDICQLTDGGDKLL